MENKSKNSQSLLGKCQTNCCQSNAINYWPSEGEKLCTSCSIIFHYKCNLKISKNKDYVEESFKIIGDIIQKLEDDGANFGLDANWQKFSEFVTNINNTFNELYERYNKDEVNLINKDIYIEGWKGLVKNIFESEAYKIWNEYSIRFQSYKQSSRKNEDKTHEQNPSSKAHPKIPQKKRSRKEDDKNKASSDNEMESNFPISKEECKDTRNKKVDEESQEVILDKINLAAILERLSTLENKHWEEKDSKKKLQKEVEELREENKNHQKIIEGVHQNIKEQGDSHRDSMASMNTKHELLIKDQINANNKIDELKENSGKLNKDLDNRLANKIITLSKHFEKKLENIEPSLKDLENRISNEWDNKLKKTNTEIAKLDQTYQTINLEMLQKIEKQEKLFGESTESTRAHYQNLTKDTVKAQNQLDDLRDKCGKLEKDLSKCLGSKVDKVGPEIKKITNSIDKIEKDLSKTNNWVNDQKLEIKEIGTKIKSIIDESKIKQLTSNKIISEHQKNVEKKLEEIKKNQKKESEDISKHLNSQREQINEELKKTDKKIEENKKGNKITLDSIESKLLRTAMKDKASDLKFDISDEVFDSWINYFVNNKNIKDPVSEFAKDAELLADISELKDKDTCEIDFSDEKDK